MLDEATGEPLIGAVAAVPGTSYYAMTDLDGLFVMEIPASKMPVDVEFSLMGYTSQVIRFEGSRKVTVRLHLEAQMLEDAQVIAYGKQSKMSITGSISSIDTKELLKSPSGSAANALAAQSVSRDLVDDHLHFFFVKAAVHVGVDHTAGDGIHTDAAGGKLLGQCTGKAVYSTFVSRIGSFHGGTCISPDGGNVDDTSGFFLQHQGNCQFAGVKDSHMLHILVHMY